MSIHLSDGDPTLPQGQAAEMESFESLVADADAGAYLGPEAVAPVAECDLDAGLETFGFESFRPGQRESIETLLDRGRLLLVAPTGGGKSLIYQLPATLLPGTTLVISPLISLMNDQVAALERFGVSATFLASTLGAAEMRERMGALARGKYQIAFVAPERLSFGGFRGLLGDLEIPLVAIDEAHCISEWGHDFRPDYLAIGAFLDELRPPRILACTATATPIVRDEILSRLGLPASTPQLLHGFARPNLALRAREVRGKKDRDLVVDAVLIEALGTPGGNEGCAIVYAPTRKTTEAETERLNGQGWRSVAYHAGLPGLTRERVHRSFSEGEVDVVVATNAFGMGIDRPDVRAVVHLAPPGSIEAYYQEVGRAGRDGRDAIGILLVSPGDLPLRRRLIEMDTDGRVPDPETIAHKWNLFLELMRWAEGGSCRHDAILRYFGDEAETLAGCGRCDVCVRLADGEEEDPAEVSLLVRKALSAVARLRGRFGLQMAAKLLRGTPDDRLSWSGLDRTKTFGILKDRSEEWLTRLLRRCVTAGWVDFDGGDRPIVVLTEEGRTVLFGDHPVRLLLPPNTLLKSRSRAVLGAARPSGRGGADVGGQLMSEEARNLFESLRSYRLETAQTQSVPPYVVASDRTLRDIAEVRPASLDELSQIHGIGPSKLQKYGEDLLKVVRESDAPNSASSK